MSSIAPHKIRLFTASLLAFTVLTPLCAQAQTLVKPPVAASKPAYNKSELVYRASLGRAADVDLLLKNGVKANDVNDDGVPVIALASQRKDAEGIHVVEALLAGGADVNAKDMNGQTALFYAAKQGNVPTVNLLLRSKVNYYALDNDGNIARTLAFNAGHNDVVTAMDNFVKGQTQVVENNQKAVVQMTKLQERQQAEDERQAAIEQARLDQENEVKAQIANEKAEAERIIKEKERAENMKKFDGMIHELSYNACAFQYWAFCKAANQTTELNAEELIEAIKAHKDKTQKMSLDMMKMFSLSGAYMNNIIATSQKKVFGQLNPMPSRTYRHQMGVGSMDDMRKRCEEISLEWDIDMPDPTKAAPKVTSKANAKPLAKKGRVAAPKSR